MRARQGDIDAVRSLAHSKKCEVFWHDEGGGEVYRIWDTLLLFSIPQYGGKGMFEGAFALTDVENIVDIAHTWT